MSDPLSGQESQPFHPDAPQAEHEPFTGSGGETPPADDPNFESPGPGSGVTAADGERRRSRRGRRGGRRRRRNRGDGPPGEGDAPAGDASPAAAGDDTGEFEADAPREETQGAVLPATTDAGPEGEEGEKPRRRRGRRGGRRRRGREGGEARPLAGAERAPYGTPAEPAPIDDDELELPRAGLPAAPEPSGSARTEEDGRPRRKRGSRGGRRRAKPPQRKPMGAVSIETIPGDDDELPELADLPDDAVLLGEPAAQAAPSRERERSRGHARSARRGRADEREDQDEDEDERIEPVRAEPHKKRVILVNARDSEEKRVAVVEEGRIVDLQMTVKKHVSYVNDIYRGRVVNIESAIGAAFVDFGEGRNGFLHASDVLVSYGDPDWNLEKLLSTPVETTPPERATEEWAEGEKPAEGEAAEAGDEPDPLHDDDAEQAPDHEHGDHDDEHEAHAGHESADDEEDDDVEEPSEGRGRSARGKRGRVMRHHARPRLPIDKLLKKGQMVAVQITKDAIGDKGPTLTTYISIPGRYLVLMPSLERTGVSRKIDDERERRRLKRILQALDIPEGMGVIVRTAGIGRTKIEIKRDLDYLLLAWEDFSKRLRAGRNPAPLYQESDVAIRTMRDLFTPETEAVIVDDPEVHQRVIEFTKRLMPEHLERVKLHEGERPLLHSYGVEQDFEKIFARRVELPSGGSIVIEQTEALVAIDVNSGRTREEGAEFEDIALKTNLEAAPEIARQIRLRDLGGIIVLDYIDMMRAGSRKSVERATRDAMGADRARAKLGRISQFGLLELTRQRLGPGLSKLVYDTCPRCRGSGRRRNASSRAQAIMRRLAAALALKGYTTVEVRTHPDAIEYLQKELAGDMKALQEKSGREIQLLPVPDQVEDSVLHYLRADGREVRPGGRRRR